MHQQQSIFKRGFIAAFLLAFYLLITGLSAQSSSNVTRLTTAESKTESNQFFISLSQLLAGLTIAGWQRDEESQDFLVNSAIETTATNISEISDNLLLKEFGCANARAQKFRQNGGQLTITAYEFNTIDGAYAAYCALRTGSSNLISLGEASSEDELSISFWKDRFYIRLVADDESEISKNAARLLAAQLASVIPTSSAKPAFLLNLPYFARVRGSEKMILGKYSLRRFFAAPSIVFLGAEPIICGATADYQLQEPNHERLRLLLLEYPSNSAASNVFSRYLGTLSGNHLCRSSDGFLYPTRIFKVNDKFLLCQLRDTRILVINNARKISSLPFLVQQVN